jgi:thymidylate kinase
MASLKLIWRLSIIGLGAVFCLLSVAHHASFRILAAELSLPAMLLVAGDTMVGDIEDRRSLPMPMAPLIAIVGCDGAGKSTLATDMKGIISESSPVELCYLGLGSGDLGNRIKQWPLIGAALEGVLAKKATQTRTKDARIPGLMTALVVFGFSILRLRRFQHMLALRRKGVIVITDRYPQTEVAGFYDGPGLSAAKAGSRLVAWLAQREKRIYVWMAGFRPDIVLRLNIDADTAFARKPDHKLALLRAKVAVTPLLRFNGARIVDLDARAPYQIVRQQSLESVRILLSRPASRPLARA